MAPMKSAARALGRICCILLACIAAQPIPLHAGDAPAQSAFEDTMAQRTKACTGCHGPQGQAGPDGYYPRLAGKPAGYLYHQLLNFKQGRRHYAPMERLIATLDDAYLMEIAQYFSALQVPYAAPKAAPLPAAQAARAKALVQHGDAARGLPACAQCHGQALTGTAPHIPGLLGLPADYLLAQLGAWRNQQRRAHAPDCMGQVARLLQPAEISAVAQWLSGQTVPVHSPAQGGRQAATKAPTPAEHGVDVTAAPWRCGRAAQASQPATTFANTQVGRGAYLARIGNCAHCHTAQGGSPYAGGRAVDTPFGAVMSSNLTPDTRFGIGRWSAEDFWQAMHHGTRPDGRALYPAFPYTSFTHLTRADTDALYAFLHTLPPAPTPNQAHALRWPYSTQAALGVWRWLFFKPADVPANAAEQRGAYLVQGAGHCDACHATRNAWGGIRRGAAQVGAVLPVGQWFAPALQPGSLQTWTEPQLQRFLQSGVSPYGFATGPMAEVVHHGTQYLTDADAQAMAGFLKQGAASASARPAYAAGASPKPTPAAATSPSTLGAALYDKHCADCHGPNGQGQPGAYPALTGNPMVQQSPINNLVLKVLYGGFAPTTAGNPRPFGMPPYLLQLNDAEIAALLSYVRSRWGNQGAIVQEFDINKLRNAPVRTP